MTNGENDRSFIQLSKPVKLILALPRITVHSYLMVLNYFFKQLGYFLFKMKYLKRDGFLTLHDVKLGKNYT